MINKIEIENFKSFLKASVELNPFNVLIGPNDSGKTNFLSAIRFLRETAIGQKRGGLLPYEISHSLIPGSGPNIKLSVEFNIDNENLNYSFVISKDSQGGIVFIEENLYDFSESGKYYLKRIRDDIVILNEKNGNTDKKTFPSDQAALPLLTDIKENRHAWLTTNEFRNILFYNFDTKKMMEFYSGTLEDQLILDESGSNLAIVLKTLKEKYPQIFLRIINIMKQEVPYLKGIDIMSHKNLIVLLIDFIGNYRLLSDMISDGFIKYLGYLTLVCSPKSAFLINIEEIENHIHPHRLENTINHLRALSVKQNNPSQVIFTTHSPNVLNLVKTDDVIIVERSIENGSSVTPLNKKHNILPFIQEMSLGDAWMSRMIGGVPLK